MVLNWANEVRKLWPQLPFVLTSGYSEVLAREGAHKFPLLQKPYSVEDLSRLVRRALGLRQIDPGGVACPSIRPRGPWVGEHRRGRRYRGRRPDTCARGLASVFCEKRTAHLFQFREGLVDARRVRILAKLHSLQTGQFCINLVPDQGAERGRPSWPATAAQSPRFDVLPRGGRKPP